MPYDEHIDPNHPIFQKGNVGPVDALTQFHQMQQMQQEQIPAAREAQGQVQRNEAVRGANFRNSVVNDPFYEGNNGKESASVVVNSKNRVAYDKRRSMPVADANKQWDADYSRDSSIVNDPLGQVGHTKEEVWAAQRRFAQNKELTKGLNAVLTGDTTVVDAQNLKNVAPISKGH